MFRIIENKYSTKGYELKSLYTDYSSHGIHLEFDCFDFYSDSYGDWGCGDKGTINRNIDFINEEGYTTELLFIEICKTLHEVCTSHKIHHTLAKKLGRFAKKPKQYIAYYFAAQIRNEMGIYYLPKPLIYYFNKALKSV